MSSSLLRALSLPLLAACAAVPESDDKGLAVGSIVLGAPHAGHPEVFAFWFGDGGVCSGTLIAPRVVATAQHCFEDVARSEYSTVRVGTGTRAATVARVAGIEDVRYAPGGADMALVVLDAPASLPPRDWVREDPGARGDGLTLIGFGDLTRGNDGGNIKRIRRSTIRRVSSGIFETEDPVACYGDSGGPALLDDGRLFGTMERGTGSGCSRGTDIYVRVDVHREFIEGVIAETGGAREPPGGPGPGAPRPDGPPSEPPATSTVCTNDCAYAYDGECDDGGPNHVTDVCALGTDCGDCGERQAGRR